MRRDRALTDAAFGVPAAGVPVRRHPGRDQRADRRAGDADRRCAAAAARRARRERGRHRHRPGAPRFRLRLTSRPRPPTPRRCGGCARRTRCGRRRPRPSALHRCLSYTWSWTVLGRAERERPGGRSHLRRCHRRTRGDVDDSGVPLGAQLMGPPNPSPAGRPGRAAGVGTGLGARPVHPVVVTGIAQPGGSAQSSSALPVPAGHPSPCARGNITRHRCGPVWPTDSVTSTAIEEPSATRDTPKPSVPVMP